VTYRLTPNEAPNHLHGAHGGASTRWPGASEPTRPAPAPSSLSS
jgi:galactose mutarotase-like enzyme